MGMSTDQLASIHTPDEVEARLGTLEFKDGAPAPKRADLLYDQLDLSRGVEAFLGSFERSWQPGDFELQNWATAYLRRREHAIHAQ
jgi:hypothetical protein